MEVTVGMKLTVREDLNLDLECDSGVTEDMLTFAGQQVTVVRVNTIHFDIEEDGGKWCWNKEMFKELIDQEVQKMKYVKARYLRNNIPTGPDYSFATELDLKIGDHVSLGEKHGKITKGVVSRVDVPFEEVEPYLDRMKTITHVLEVPEIPVTPNVAEVAE